MRFNNILPELYIIDFKKSLYFYTNILGFKLEYQRPDPLFAFLSYQGSQLMIQQEDEDEVWHNGKPEFPFGRGINFQIETDNVQTLIDSLGKNNYPLKRGVKDSWYKVKDLERRFNKGVKYYHHPRTAPWAARADQLANQELLRFRP